MPTKIDPEHQRRSAEHARVPERARRWFGVFRSRYDGSWVQEVATQLKDLRFLEWTTVFGAELLWSALPFVILLGSLADERIDDDLSRHIGLNSHGARIVRSLFRNKPVHALVPILTGLLITLAGVVAVVGSLQLIYERLFEQERRGWRGLPRQLAWVGVLLGVLIAEGVINDLLRKAVGPLVQGLVGFLVVTAFFGWTMHFLLAGRVPRRSVIRPAFVTGLLWLGLALFSSQYFSSVLIEDSHTYGTIGVVFTLLTWFILIGGVVVLGAALGAVWQKRRGSIVGDAKKT